jgi:hypothetical protein
MTSGSIIHTNLHKLNNKLINAWFEHFWCMDESRANTDSQDSSHPKLGGNHHLLPYKIFMFGHRANTQMSFCPGGPKLGVQKFLKLGFLQLWRPITSCADLWLRWGLKQSCSPRWKNFNDMWFITWTQLNQGDSRLSVVGSQIGSLTPIIPFGHNLCVKYPGHVGMAHTWRPSVGYSIE